MIQTSCIIVIILGFLVTNTISDTTSFAFVDTDQYDFDRTLQFQPQFPVSTPTKQPSPSPSSVPSKQPSSTTTTDRPSIGGSLPSNYPGCSNGLDSWTNAFGQTCATFANAPGLCDTDFATNIVGGRNALTNCCACGGGTVFCTDLFTGWRDSFDNSCEDYKLFGACQTHGGCCGSNTGTDGSALLTAGTVCCVCGGGESSPTPAPVTSGILNPVQEPSAAPSVSMRPSSSPTSSCDLSSGRGNGCPCTVSPFVNQCAEGLTCARGFCLP